VFLRRLAAQMLLVAATMWVAAIVAVPHVAQAERLGDAHPMLAAATGLVYLTGSFVCHQRPERSFHEGRVQYPVCARCTGLYVAAPFGLLAALLWGRVADARAYRRWRLVLFAALIPTVVSIALERLGGPSDTVSRAIAALPLGAAAAAFVGAVVLGHFAHGTTQEDACVSGSPERSEGR
jgi:uncharacterized membrane protein